MVICSQNRWRAIKNKERKMIQKSVLYIICQELKITFTRCAFWFLIYLNSLIVLSGWLIYLLLKTLLIL